MKPVAQKLKDNPLVTVVVSVSVLFTAIVSITASMGVFDTWVLSEAEFEQGLHEHNQGVHPATQELIEKISKKDECRWLDDKIARLEDRLWELRDRNADPEYIREKQRELDKLERRFIDEGCSTTEY